MKHILILLLIVLTPILAFGQTSTQEMVTVPKTSLTAQQLAQVELDATKTKAAQYGSWVGIGKEVGVAVNDALAAVTVQANNFGQTGVGQITIAVVVWKVIGHDLMKFVVCGTFLTFGVPLWVWLFYKNCMTHRILIKRTGKDCEWETVNTPGSWPRKHSDDLDPLVLHRMLHFGMLSGFIGLMLLIMFA